VPFRNAVIHGLVRDVRGRKMSKSIGNVIDPIEIIDRYGADALRFALARAATGSQQDIPLSEEAIEGARHFANKLWNAARLVFRAYRGGTPELPPPEHRTLAERWLLSRHEACRAEVDDALDEFRFADAAQALHRFVWSEYCDWGLEVEKGRLDADGHERADAAHVLAWVLERTVRMLHPIMPFVTEEIWQRFGIGESVAVAPWPRAHPDLVDRDAERSFGLAQDVATAVRQFRARHGLSPRDPFEVTVEVPAADRATIDAIAPTLERLLAVSGLRTIEAPAGKAAGETTMPFSWGSVRFPAGLYDEEEERRRLAKRRDEVDAALERSRRKLANEGFRSKAAPEVVAGEEGKAASLEAQLAAIDAELAEHGG
jgi:valyl-tRNA synthetase